MSARFAELMALSAAQTQDSDAATKQILEEKRRKEEQRRKEQLEKEKRDREFRERLVKKKAEEQQHAEERRRKQEEERQRKEELIRQREEEQRRNLIYGKNRIASGSGTGGRGRKNGSDDDEEVGGLVLTREEKRQRKLLSDLNKSFPSARKGHASPMSRGSKKSSRFADGMDPSSARSMEPRHPQDGSAGPNSDSTKSIQAVRKQLAAMPATLVRLGASKRDNRTIDEISTDMQKKKEAKIVNGEEARRNGFDWFGEQRKAKKATPLPSLSPSPRASHSPRSRSREPAQPAKSFGSASTHPRANGTNSERKEPRTKVTIIKPEPVGSVSFTKTTKVHSSTPLRSAVVSKPTTSQSASATARLASSSYRKRARSDSLSDSDASMSDGRSPPPVKRRPPRNDISSEIWKLFGKDRDRYMANDVFSDDDDDMEADAEALRREELRSARIAKKEDELAAEEEKRHEEEKRKKKKDKDRRAY